MSLGLEESARLAGAHSWWEGRLFEILGAWVASSPEPALKLMLDRHSQHHAWRARQWWDRLPVLAAMSRESLVRAPSSAEEELMEALAQLEPTVERLAGAYRVSLPRLAGAYDRHRSLTTEAADGAVIWTIGLVSADLGRDWREGEVFLQSLISNPGEAQTAAQTVARLEAILTPPTGTV